ncbi:MAG: hypothetical protein Q9173_000468 [Seirophora scorigena]
MLIQVIVGLDDLCVRFIINLPQEELESVERICFQVEEAQWYYEDFIRPLDPDLPSLNLRNFCLRIFQHCPLLSEFSPDHHATAFEEFLAYKTRVPVRGAIMLNEEMDEVILVKGWKKGANWSFPRGKINKDESDLACAIREVYEETGYDVEAAGLVDSPETMKYIDVAIQHQHIRLYVFRGVPKDTAFEARTRKEISKIEWWKLSDLPTLRKKKQQQEGRGEDLASNANKFYMVAPFLVPLKKWISQQKKMEHSKTAHQLQPNNVEAEVLPTESNGLDGTQAVAVSEDMERLLAGLRQPARIPVDTVASANEASRHLKELLRVRPQEPSPSAPVEPTPLSAEAKKASTLLALLKGGPPTQAALVPQVPKAEPSNVSTLPAYPLAAEHSAQIQSQLSSGSVDKDRSSVAAWNNFETTAAEQDAARRMQVANKRSTRLEEEKRTEFRHEPTLPAMNETWRQVKGGQDATMGQAGQRQIAQVIKRSIGGPQHSYESHQRQTEDATRQQAASNVASGSATAPYQKTSKMPVATNSQYPDIYRTAIPAANKLPMPKLTAHSSSLLNLFRGEQPTRAAQDMLSSSTADPILNHQPHGPLAPSRKEEAVESSKLSNVLGGSAAPPKPASLVMPKSSEQKRPQSAQQATLLDLFRKPAISKPDSTPPPGAVLDVPADLVELSAVPSPGHSRVPLQADTKEPQDAPASISDKSTTLQKRAQVRAKRGQPPVFATVGGPVNVPHFDKTANKARDSAQEPAVAKDVKKSPVRILARPANTNMQASIQQTVERRVKSSHANGPGIPPPAGLSKNNKKVPSPKQFQPQILRRPPPTNEAAASLEASNMGKPFAPPKQETITTARSRRLSGDGSDSPSRAPAPPRSPSKVPLSEMEKPSHRMTDFPEAHNETDGQSFSVAHASLRSGQRDSQRQEQSEQSMTESHTQAHQEPSSPWPMAQSIEKREAPSPLSGSDRRGSVKPDHKATLLSLFTRTSSPTTSRPSSRPDLSAFVSPMTAQPPSLFPKGSNDEIPDWKVSNFTSARNDIGEGAIEDAAKNGESQQTAKKTTNDADRKFLLGYLEGVARKEGR